MVEIWATVGQGREKWQKMEGRERNLFECKAWEKTHVSLEGHASGLSTSVLGTTLLSSFFLSPQDALQNSSTIPDAQSLEFPLNCPGTSHNRLRGWEKNLYALSDAYQWAVCEDVRMRCPPSPKPHGKVGLNHNQSARSNSYLLHGGLGRAPFK